MKKPSAANTRPLGREGRPEDDNYPTTPAAVRALLTHEMFPTSIWDPFAGAGVLLAVVRECLEAPMIGTTLHDYGDQFGLGIKHHVDFKRTTYPPPRAMSIISNPAYGLVKANDGDLINKMLDLNMNKTALLMDASFLESEGRYENVFKRRAPDRIYHFADRVTMIPHRLWEGKNDPEFPHGGTEAFAWMVWEYPYKPPPSLAYWLKAKDFAKHDDLEKYQVDLRAKARARRLL